MFGRFFLFLFRKYISFFSDNPPVLDKNTAFPPSLEFEAHWQEIRKELDAYLALHWEKVPNFSDVDQAQKDLIENDNYNWKVLIVKMYGAYVNTQVSPTLMNLLKKYDQLISSAIFSCMDPEKHIPAHYGPNKAVLRYTLPLKVPQGDCYLMVAGQKLPLVEGQGIFWDDTYLHAAVNASPEVRIALLLDIKRKMPKHLDWAYEFILSLARKTPKFKKACAAAMV